MKYRWIAATILAATLMVIAAPAIERTGNTTLQSTATTSILQTRQAGPYCQTYTGDGTSGWPNESQWIPDYEEMFQKNRPIRRSSCAWMGQADNSEKEINDLHNVILSVAGSSGIDARVILTFALQESRGCVRTKTTDNHGRNPGIMQNHNSDGTCWPGVSPCPYWQIEQMIKDGAARTRYGESIAGCIARSGASGATAVYRAARLYNSGSWLQGTGLENPNGATGSYSSDIANRLIGVVF